MKRAVKNRNFPLVFTWLYKGAVYHSSVLPVPCAMCGAVAVVKLPDDLLAEQPDDTTHLCHPVAGGCNHGFAKDDDSPADRPS